MRREPRRFALIGDPVAHSLSPRMHAAAFEALGIQAEYGLERVPAGDSAAVAAAMRRLAALGGGNVTVPHKGAAALAVDEASDTVRDTGACNCFWQTAAGRLAGDNTDVAGIIAVLRDHLTVRGPREVFVLGAGGAAAAAAVAVGRLGAHAVHIVNRTPHRADRLAARLRAIGVPARSGGWPAAGHCDAIINATSLGLSAGDPLPASFDRVTARVALDLVYGPAADADAEEAGTPWTRAAEARGIAATDGREVLLRQGAACYPHWFGVDAPLEAMRVALAEAT